VINWESRDILCHIEQILTAYERLILRPAPKYPRATLDVHNSMSKEYGQQKYLGLTPSRMVFFPNFFTVLQILHICTTTTDEHPQGSVLGKSCIPAQVLAKSMSVVIPHLHSSP